MNSTVTEPNTYFTNRIAPASEINRVLSVSATKGDKGIFFCVPRRIAKTDLSRMIVRWKSPTSEVFLQGDITEIVDGDSPEGMDYRAQWDSRPWGDLASWDEGSVIRVRNLSIFDPPSEVSDLHHIQSCKYICT